MGFFDRLFGSSSDAQAPQHVNVRAPAGARAYGTGKPAEEMTDEDVRESNEILYRDCSDRIKAWRFDCGLDYRSTLFELAVDGMEAPTREQLPTVPEELTLRCRALPITATKRLLDDEEPTHSLGVSLLAETREELEAVKGARIYGTKSKKKETGQCYFRAAKDVRCNRGEDAGTFLANTNKLTRRVVLGDELAMDFEKRTAKGGITPQQWIEQVLRPIVFNPQSPKVL